MPNSLDRILDNALAILEKVGYWIHDEKAVNLAVSHGARAEGKRVFFPPRVILDWIARAPEYFDMSATNGSRRLSIGGDSRVFAPGFGAPAVIDWDGTRRDATLDDFIKMARLNQGDPHMEMISTLTVQPNDVPAHLSHLVVTLACLSLTDQPLVAHNAEKELVTEMCDLIDIRAGRQPGEKGMRPEAVFMSSVISPLQVDKAAIDTMFTALDRGQAAIIGTAPAPGVTGPIELAGNLSLGIAEVLGLIAVAQMYKSGSPVVYGPTCYGADLRQGNMSIGSPDFARQSRYACELGRRLGLPSRATGPVSDAAGVTARAGMESMLNLATVWSHGADMIVHGAGILDRFAAMSLEKFVLDLEALDMVVRYNTPIATESRENLALEIIDKVGPGSNFLTEMETCLKTRTHSWHTNLDAWGQPRTGDAHQDSRQGLQNRLEALLNAYSAPEMAPETATAMGNYMTGHGVAPEVVSAITEGREKN